MFFLYGLGLELCASVSSDWDLLLWQVWGFGLFMILAFRVYTGAPCLLKYFMGTSSSCDILR